LHESELENGEKRDNEKCKSLGDLQKDFAADLEGRRRWVCIPGHQNFILIWFLRPLRWTTTVVLTGWCCVGRFSGN